jgi:hypothetical protein
MHWYVGFPIFLGNQLPGELFFAFAASLDVVSEQQAAIPRSMTKNPNFVAF